MFSLMRPLRLASRARARVSAARRVTQSALPAALLAVAMASGAAAAQDEGFGGDKKEGAEEPANAPETYTVQPGDTLWNLSAKYLNNPWYWPKVWSYNPGIDNPNWIQPGTVIRFLPGDTQQGTTVVPEESSGDGGDGDGEGEGEEAGQDEFDNQDDIYDVEDGTIDTKDAVDAIKRTADRGKWHRSRLRWFATPSELEDAGQLMHSPSEAHNLSIGDKVYLQLKEEDYEGEFVVYTPVRELRHPITGTNMGSVVKVTGQVRVLAVQEGGEALAEIFKSWEVIERGSYVTRDIKTKISELRPNKPDKDLRGYVVDSTIDPEITAGENYLVFIDLGEGEGVKPGDLFDVVRAMDPVTGDDDELADEVIGELMVLDVRDGVSTCEVRRSFRSIVPGDRIEMSPADGAE